MSQCKRESSDNRLSQPVPMTSVLKVVYVNHAYSIGISSLNRKAKVCFCSAEGFEQLDLLWQGYPLLPLQVKCGVYYPVHPDAGLGRYRFGIRENDGFPYFIDIEDDGQDYCNYTVFTKEDYGTDLRIAISAQEAMGHINFAVADEFDGTAKILSCGENNFPPIKLDRQNSPQKLPLWAENSPKVLVKVEPWINKHPWQTVGGAEAEIDIEPIGDKGSR